MSTSEKRKHVERERTPKIGILFFLVILFLPLLLTGIEKIFLVDLDVELNGYTENVEKPTLTAKSFFSGEFQDAYTKWFNSNFSSKGFFTKLYSTIRYKLFHLGNRPIGENGDVFELSYILSDLSISPDYDLSVSRNQEIVNEYVEKLEKLQKKLQAFDKQLYVYVASDKVDFNIHNVPNSYKALANKQGITPEDYLIDLISDTTIPYLDSREIGKTLEYPTFYTTGIHWSRPFEQRVSQQILKDLAEITGESYRQIHLGEINESSEPYWRDCDVYDLLNIWDKNENTYYEYTMNREYPAEYDDLGMLLYGTSFADGLRSDIQKVYPMEDVYYVNRDEYFMSADGQFIPITDGWSTINLAQYLDDIDVVVIEHLSYEILNGTYGFVDYLLQLLENYTPGEKPIPAINMLNFSVENNSDTSSAKGFWGAENGFSWVKDECELYLRDDEISRQGVRLDFLIPQSIVDNYGEQTVNVYVNGKKVFDKNYYEQVSESIVIPPDKLELSEHGEDVYQIAVLCSDSFIPEELGLGNDSRALAIMITYIGRA